MQHISYYAAVCLVYAVLLLFSEEKEEDLLHIIRCLRVTDAGVTEQANGNSFLGSPPFFYS